MAFIRFLFAGIFFLLLSWSVFSQNSIPLNFKKVNSFDVHFDFDEYDIKKKELRRLNNFGEMISKDSVYRILLTGHTDAKGSNDYNIRLSKKRADTIRAFLLGKEVAPDFIIMDYFGEKQPIAPNTTDQGREKNRRVEISLYKPSGKPMPVVKKSADLEWDGIIYGNVFNGSTGESIEAAVELFYKSGREALDGAINRPGQGYTLKIDSSTAYDVICTARGYMYKIKSAEKKQWTQSDSVEINFELEPIEKGKKFEAENIYFFPNLPVVTPESIQSMQELLYMMELNETVRIEIRGHVNWPTTYQRPITRDAEQLSQKRAKTVYEYLVRNGIKPSRLKYNGYGNKEMVYPDARSNQEFRKNMRVEIYVLDI